MSYHPPGLRSTSACYPLAPVEGRVSEQAVYGALLRCHSNIANERCRARLT